MKTQIDMKSAVVGAVLGVAVCLLAGVAGNRLRETIGRFRLACEDNRTYLVDTVTGQVWNSTSRDFRKPKLIEMPAATALPKEFIGQWRSDNPADDLGLRLDADGRVHATEGDTKRYEGMWRVEGDRIVIMIEDERLLGEIDPDGRLSLWEKGNENERKSFQRVQ